MSKGRQREVLSSAYSPTVCNGRVRSGPGIQLQSWALLPTLALSLVCRSYQVISMTLGPALRGDRGGADKGDGYDPHTGQLPVRLGSAWMGPR